MKRAFPSITIVSLLFLCISQNAAGQWVLANIPAGDQPLCFMQNGTNLFVGTVDSGIYLSTNDGASWTPMGLPAKQIHALATIGSNIFAGISDEIGDGAVYISKDNGSNWSILPNGPSTAVLSLAVQGSTLYAGTATGTGIYVSTNNGTTWKTETGTGAATIQTMAVIGSNMFAGTDQGMFRSTNNGSSWSAINSGFGLGANINSLVVIGPNLFAAVYFDGVYLTTNNGDSWNAVNSGLTENNALTLTSTGSNLFVGTDSGVFLSTNNGTLWTSVSTGATDSNAYFLAVAGSYLYCQTYRSVNGLYRRPLSEMIGTNAVAQTPVDNTQQASAYPNPFTESTNISFISKAEGETEVSVVNLLGDEVAKIYSGQLSSGDHTFKWDAKNMTAGTYFGIVRADGEEFTVPIVLAR